jgi:serine/threonine protein kinase/tetratricopeptide (TPR) repeat protein
MDHLPIGTVLDGKFKIVQVLGEGGMGTVYKVELVGRPGYFSAIKELLISQTMAVEERNAAIERFNREIDLLSKLKHPRIPTFMYPFQERGNNYFLMEFVPGQSLDKKLEDNKGPLDEQAVIKWMMQVCEALSYIHSLNPPIILRDLKPGNIMVMPDGNIQLIDFGIARRFDPNKRTNTENLGTISYASPEHLGSITMPGQKRSPQNPGKLVQTDARSDIYSLGATMYHLLTNYEPDPIQTPAEGSIKAKNPRLRTVTVNGRVLCPVERVIIKAMQQNPAQRFQNAEAMRMALQQCLPGAATASTTIQIPAAASPNATVIVPAQAASIVCPKCGFKNRPGAKFCKRDGQPLVQGATAVPPQVRMSGNLRQPIKARPVQPAASTAQTSPRPNSSRPIQSRPIQARPAQPVQPGGIHQAAAPRPAPIRARPVTSTGANGQNNQNGQARQGVPVRPLGSVAQAGSDVHAAYRLGLDYLKNKHYIEALNQFKYAVSQGKPSYDMLYNFGRAYRQYGQSARGGDSKDARDNKLFTENMKLAAEQFDAATHLKPDAVDSFFQLGMSYRDLGLYTQATAAFKKAQQFAPADPAIYYQLGLVAMEQGYQHEAEAYFQEGLRIKPDHPLILISLGHLYGETRQMSLATNTLLRATQCDPDLPDGWYELGRIHMKENEWSRALSALEQARQRNSDAPEIYTAMGTCYLKLKKKSEARQMAREALQRDPNNAEAIRLQKQL